MFFLILALLFEIIFLGNAVHLVYLKDYTFIFCFTLFVLILFGYPMLFSFIIFQNNIVVFNKYKKNIIKYNELKKIIVKTSVKHAFLIGATIEIILIKKNMDNKKILIGQVFFYKKIIEKIKKMCLYKCIKFELMDE